MVIKRTACQQCSNWCGVLVHIDDHGQIKKILPDKGNPLGKAGLCVKSASSIDFHYHKSRLNFPLKRVGQRGEGKWQRISWNQAMDEIAEKLSHIKDESGPEALAYVGGDHRPNDAWSHRWCNLFGTPNIFYQGKNCGSAELLMDMAVLGYPILFLTGIKPGVTKCILIWGSNLAETNHRIFKLCKAAKDRGAILVVIDPRRTKTAEYANIHLQPRPGTDGALGLAMLNVIINENLYDKQFVENWCLGFEELKDYVQGYTLKEAEKITWIPRKDIEKVAKTYATNKPSHITWGAAVAHFGKGEEGDAVKAAAQCKSILRSICGNLEIEGGHPFRDSDETLALIENMHYDKILDHPLRTKDSVGAENYRISSLRAYRVFREAMSHAYPKGFSGAYFLMGTSSGSIWEAILNRRPYPIKAIITQGSNPLVSMGNSKIIYRALKDRNLDMHVSMDFFMTPSSALADYVLPAADWLEKPFFIGQFGGMGFYFAGEQCVLPLYERQDDYIFWKDLGTRLGQEDYWSEMVDKMFDTILSPLEVTFHELLKKKEPWIAFSRSAKGYEKRGFGTFSGKVEFVPSILKKLGYDPLPRYGEPPRSPASASDMAQEYPLILVTTGRVKNYYFSCYRQIEVLRKRYPHPLLEIHPETALELGISDGDDVMVETPEGKIRQKAKLTDKIDPRVVHADSHWWYPEKPCKEPSLGGVWESNINAITFDDPKYNSFEGDTPISALLCKIYKA